MKCDVYAYALLSDCKYVIAILKHPFLPAALDHVIFPCGAWPQTPPRVHKQCAITQLLQSNTTGPVQTCRF